MVSITPAAVLAAVPGLALAELERLAKAVDQAIQTKRRAPPPPAPVGPGPACPHCGTADPRRWGTAGQTRRWRCRGCRKTFTEFTGTPLAFAKRRPQFLAAAADMLADKPLSCRKLAKTLGVHHMTVWRWRLRMLRAVEEIGDVTTGLAEADETFFRESRKGSREWALFAKGMALEPPRPRWRDFDHRKKKLPRGLSRWQIPILTLRDRHGATYARRLPNLKLPAFEAVLDVAVAPDAVLCTDGGAVYRRWALPRKRVLEQVNSRRGIRVRKGVYHIQNANAFHSRLKAFMRPFCGPATRHLPLYVGWMVLRDQLRANGASGQPLI